MTEKIDRSIYMKEDIGKLVITITLAQAKVLLPEAKKKEDNDETDNNDEYFDGLGVA